jgi:tRNA threonylcarbamoyladenosine biosynthesis protein TsaB
VQDVLTEGGVRLTDLDALAFGRGPAALPACASASVLQGLALGAELPMIGVSTLATMAQGAWRKTGATRVLAAIDARMGEVYWAEYQRDEQGVWHGEETEAVLKPEAVTERLQQLSGEWATVGTGWQAWPDMAKDTGLTLTDGGICCRRRKICCRWPPSAFAGKTVAVNKRSRFICVTTWRGRNFRAASESQ